MATNNDINNTSGAFTVTNGNLVVTAGTLTTTGTITSATSLTASNGAITVNSGNLVLTSGNIVLPTTTSSVGQIKIGGNCVAQFLGTSNTFLGVNAGNLTFNTTNAGDNVACGYSALAALTGASGGIQNVAFGYKSLTGLTIGGTCNCVGQNTATGITSAATSSFLGSNAGGTTLSTGSYNYGIGYQAASSLGAASTGCVCIGANANGSSSVNSRLDIGTSSTTACYIQGIYGTTTASGVNVYVSSGLQVAKSSSSRTVKQDIQPMGDDSSVLYNLRPTTFKYKNLPDTQPLSYGMIAEEVEPLFPEMVTYEDDKPIGLYYQFLTPMLVNEIQKLEKIVASLEAAVALKGL